VLLQTDLAVVGKNTAANSQLTEENGALPNELANKVPFFFSSFWYFQNLDTEPDMLLISPLFIQDNF
jgi:hypothetical protein